MCQQIAAACFKANAGGEVSVVHCGTDLRTEAVVCVAIVQSRAELHCSRQQRLLRALPLAASFDQQPQALDIGIGSRERLGNGIGRQRRHEGIRLQRPNEVLSLGQFAAQAERRHAQVNVRVHATKIVHQSGFALPAAGQCPQIQAVAERPVNVGEQRRHIQRHVAFGDAGLTILEIGCTARHGQADQRVARQSSVDAQIAGIDVALDAHPIRLA